MKRAMKNAGILIVGLAFAVSGLAAERTIRLLPEEHWWGAAAGLGTAMPFDVKTDRTIDLASNNYDNPAAPFLVSDKGRSVWCTKPPRFVFKSGDLAVTCADGEILVDETGASLADAYRTVSRHFACENTTPDELFFSAPQYNTWIELTYNQNEKDVLAYARSMLDHGLPPGVIMIDDTWQEGYGTWDFAPRRFPNSKAMCDKLHELGFKVMVWMCPFVSMDSPAYREIVGGLHYKGPGGFVSTPAKDGWTNDPATISWWNGRSAMLDFTHPNAVRWYDCQLKRLQTDYGIDGFKFDGGDICYYTRGAKAYDPKASAAEQAAAYGRFPLASRTSEYRNSYANCGKPVAVRLLDKGHDWPSLQKLIPDMLATGLTGHPFVCPDMIGGGDFVAFLPESGHVFDEELFVRSAQVHALSPMMQFSASPWRVCSAAGQAAVKAAVATRNRFAAEIVNLARESGRTGEPMMRCLEYGFPGLGYATVQDEFLMGSNLLVAPQIVKGAKTRKVVIPPGTWVSDCGVTVTGPCVVDEETPLERLPYYVRQQPKEGPVKVIFDTDMYTDFDDAGALASLHALADAGECEILATIANTRESMSVAMCEIINAYYGRPDIPVGCVKGIGMGNDRGGEHQRRYGPTVEKFARWVKHRNSDDAPDAVEVYRRVLSAQPDHSVVICSVGFLSNMRKLMETDRDLVARKVKLWVAMACSYPNGKEYNSMMDAESSRVALEKWPTPIIFTDFQYGVDCFAGRVLAEKGGADNPVADVFRVNVDSCNGRTGRSAWDETAVLIAVRGVDSYFNIERGTYRMVGTDGRNEWIADPNARDCRVTEKLSKAAVGQIIDELICRSPQK